MRAAITLPQNPAILPAMKVAETTPDRLVIEDRPWFLWIILPILGAPALFAALTGQVDGWGATILVAALGFGTFWVLWHFAPFQRFTFDRSAGTFTHEVYRLRKYRVWERPLSDIRRAADEGHWSDGSRLERVTLLTTDGRHPLESGFSSQKRKPVIEAINAWLEDNRGD